MNLEGKWQLVDCHQLNSSQNFKIETVQITFKEFGFTNEFTGFLKTSIRSSEQFKSSIYSFKWRFMKLTNRLKIQYNTCNETEFFQVNFINQCCIELTNGKLNYIFKKA